MAQPRPCLPLLGALVRPYPGSSGEAQNMWFSFRPRLIRPQIGYPKPVWPSFCWGAFLRSGRPRGPGKAFKSVGAFAPHIFEGFPGPPGPARLQTCTQKTPARPPSGTQPRPQIDLGFICPPPRRFGCSDGSRFSIKFGPRGLLRGSGEAHGAKHHGLVGFQIQKTHFLAVLKMILNFVLGPPHPTGGLVGGSGLS